MKVNLKSALSTVSAAAEAAKIAVSDKVQIVKDTHTVKSSLTDEQKETLKVQGKMIKAMQVAAVRSEAEKIRAAKEAEKAAKVGQEFADAYLEACSKAFTVTS